MKFENSLERIENKIVENLIYEIRGMQVMLDGDVALCFNVSTKRLNEQMRRNIERFPKDFCFKLNKEEIAQILRSQFAATSILSSKEDIIRMFIQNTALLHLRAY